MKIGDSTQEVRTFSQDGVQAYGRLGGNISHTGDVPEPLIGALFSYLLGVKLPGPGTNYLKQHLEFIEVAKVGERLTAQVTITQLRPEKHLVDLETICTKDDGTTICQGRALVYVRDIGSN